MSIGRTSRLQCLVYLKELNIRNRDIKAEWLARYEALNLQEEDTYLIRLLQEMIM